MMFWTRLGSSVVLVVLALIFLISGGPVLGAVCLLLSLTAYYELIKACHVEKMANLRCWKSWEAAELCCMAQR